MMVLGAKSHDPQRGRGCPCVRNGAAERAPPCRGEGGRGGEEEGEGGDWEDEENEKGKEDGEGDEAWSGINRAAATSYCCCCRCCCLLKGWC